MKVLSPYTYVYVYIYICIYVSLIYPANSRASWQVADSFLQGIREWEGSGVGLV